MLKRLRGSLSGQFSMILWGFVGGVLVAPIFLFVPDFVWLAVVGLALLTASLLVVFQRRVAACVLVLIAVSSFGILRFSQSTNQPSDASVSDFTEQTLRVRGVVAGEVEQRGDGQRITLDDIQVKGSKNASGKVLLFFDTYPRVSYGDELVFRCGLERPAPFSGFAYDTYLAIRGIYAVCYQPHDLDVLSTSGGNVFIGTIFKIKQGLVGRIEEMLSEPHAGFVTGLLFGGSSTLPDTLQDDFAHTGTSHILAASGFNVSLFSFLLLSWIIQTPVGRKRGLVVTGCLVAAYVVASGADPAVVRAAIMAGILLYAQFLGRRSQTTRVMVLTLAVMLLFEPRWLLYDVGFQLSFIATYAVLVVAPYWDRHFRFIPDTFALREAFVGSLAAITFTLPIVLWHFSQLPVVAPVVNLLVLPIVPYLMLVACLGVLFGAVLPSVWLGLSSWLLSLSILLIIRWFGALPFASVEIPEPKLFAVLISMLLLSYVMAKKQALQKQHILKIS